MGSSKDPVPHLGTSQLHRRHSVLIEPGVVPRARVMDQTLYDRYMMDGLITPGQHRAADFIHAIAVKAGMFARSQDYAPKIKTPAKSAVLIRGGTFSKVCREIRMNLSPEHERVTVGVVCRALDVSTKGQPLTKLRESLSYVEENRTGSRRDPLALLEMNRPKKKRRP